MCPEAVPPSEGKARERLKKYGGVLTLKNKKNIKIEVQGLATYKELVLKLEKCLDEGKIKQSYGVEKSII